MRVWVDITNSPHVLFFRPLIRLLQADGHDVSITAREYAQTLELLELHGLAHEVVGPRHGGAGVLGKARALVGRLPALRRFAKPRAFDLALAHGSHELTLAARSLGIPSATAHDYEFATLQHQLGLRAATRVVFPDAIPAEPARTARCEAAEARQVSGDRGGVLPRRLRAGSRGARRHRPGQGARGRANAAGRLALPPARQPALHRRARAARPRRVRARRRTASDGRAARVDSRPRPPLAPRPGARSGRPEPRRAGRSHRLCRGDDEPGGRGARHTRVHHVHGPRRGGRRAADRAGSTSPSPAGRARRSQARSRCERVRRDPRQLLDLLVGAGSDV